MEELRSEVIRITDKKLCEHMTRNADNSPNPYISVCMTYLRFSRDEPQLFKLLFMRDRVSEGDIGREYKHDWGFPVIERSFGVDRDTAIQLYERTFFHTHGLAVCFATKYMSCMDEERMEAIITANLRAAAASLGVHLQDV